MNTIETENRKPCIRCCEPIHIEAKACPHCYRWQSKWAFDPHSPQAILFGFGMLGLFLLGMFGFVWLTASDSEEPTPDFYSSLSVVVTETLVVKDPDGDFVTVLATISNSSDLAWDHIHFQVDFKNEQGEIIDSSVDQNYDLIVPPLSQVRFRINRAAIRASPEYSESSIEVLSATRNNKYGN